MTYSTHQSAVELAHRFAHHAPSAEKIARHQDVRDSCTQLAHQLDRDLPPGRDKARALTALEDTLFSANAAIARNAITAPAGIRIGGGYYEHTSITDSHAGWVEGTRADGSKWIIYLDQDGSPAVMWPHRDEDGGVVGVAVDLKAATL